MCPWALPPLLLTPRISVHRAAFASVSFALLFIDFHQRALGTKGESKLSSFTHPGTWVVGWNPAAS